jgi:hypothetical protein
VHVFFVALPDPVQISKCTEESCKVGIRTADNRLGKNVGRRRKATVIYSGIRIISWRLLCRKNRLIKLDEFFRIGWNLIVLVEREEELFLTGGIATLCSREVCFSPLLSFIPYLCCMAIIESVEAAF